MEVNQTIKEHINGSRPARLKVAASMDFDSFTSLETSGSKGLNDTNKPPAIFPFCVCYLSIIFVTDVN